MAIAFDAHTVGISTSGTFSSPQTFSHTTGSGSNRLLVVSVQMRGGAGGVVTGVTYNGVAMTEVTTEALSNSAHTAMFYLANPDSGSHTVSIAHTLSGTMNLVAMATTLENVDQSSPLNAFNKAATNDAGPMSTSVTSTVADCWVIDSCAMRVAASDTATMTAVTNRVPRADSLTAANGLRGLCSTIGPAASAGSHTVEWTKSLSQDWAIMAAAFAPAATGTTIAITATTIDFAEQAVSTIAARIASVMTAAMAYTGQALSVIRATTIAVVAGAMNYAGKAASAASAGAAGVVRQFLNIGLGLGL